MLKECSLAYPGTVILTVQSMCGINMLLSHSSEGKNSQEFKDSQQLIFNPSEFLKYLSLQFAHGMHSASCTLRGCIHGGYYYLYKYCHYFFFKLDLNVAISQ